MTSSQGTKWKKQVVKMYGFMAFYFLKKCIEKSNKTRGSELIDLFLTVFLHTHIWGSSAFCFFADLPRPPSSHVQRVGDPT